MNTNEPMEIGKIVNTHGLKGEIKVDPWCDDMGIFSELDTVFEQGVVYKIENVRFHKNNVILKLGGVDSIEAAEKMKNKILLVNRSQLGELPESTFYIKDLIGIDVYENDKKLGIVEDCFSTGGSDVYAVRSEEGKQLLLPAIKQVIKKVDINARRMEVELMEGLGDEV